MNLRKLFGLVAVVALVAACGELGTEPTPLDSDLLSVAADANPVVGSASGSGHNPCGIHATLPICDTGPDAPLRTFSFNAQVYADGSVGGRAQFINRNLGGGLKMDIACMRFFGVNQNRAWLLGPITHTDDPVNAPVGLVVGFAVEDNGEGEGSVPDGTTGWGPGPDFFTAPICDHSLAEPPPGFDFWFDNVFGFETVNGNVQVRAP